MTRWIPAFALGLVAALLAWHATLVATPLVLMRAALNRVQVLGGVNVMRHPPLADARSRTIVRPSPDLAYGSCAFDLSAGPVVVTIVPTPAPYWSLSVFDRRTDAVFVRNNRDTRGGPIRIALARPGQAVPAGVETVRLSGDRGIALLRILVEDRSRFPAIDRARRTSSCATLQATGGTG